jgi:hypothetical protein
MAGRRLRFRLVDEGEVARTGGCFRQSEQDERSYT